MRREAEQYAEIDRAILDAGAARSRWAPIDYRDGVPPPFHIITFLIIIIIVIRLESFLYHSKDVLESSSFDDTNTLIVILSVVAREY